MEAAIGLADEAGIGSLSMRRLAQELGVEAMTLYYYVANKNEILDGIVDMVVAEMELPPGRRGVEGGGAPDRDLGARGPPGPSLGGGPAAVAVARQPGRLRWIDALLGTLRGAGFSAEMTDHAYHALDSHIMGFTLWVVGMDLNGGTDLEALATEFLAQLPRSEMPHLAEHVEQHLKPREADDEGDFVFGLDLILDGLERILIAT